MINNINNPALQADLLSAMSILAGEKYSAELIRKFVRMDMLMGSPLFDECFKEEREEAAKEATEKQQ